MDSPATAYDLGNPPLGKGPIDVTLGIFDRIETLVIGLIEWDVFFQLVRQIGLRSSLLDTAEEIVERKTHVGQEILSVTNQSTCPIRELHAFLTIIPAVAHEDFGGPDFAKEVV